MGVLWILVRCASYKGEEKWSTLVVSKKLLPINHQGKSIKTMAMAHRFTEIDYSVRRFRGLSGPKPQPKQLWIHRKHATCCTTWMHSKVRRRSL